MSFWLQIQHPEESHVLPDNSTGYDLINLDMVERLHLDISDLDAATITAVKNGEKLVLIKDWAPYVISAWSDLCKNVKARSTKISWQEGLGKPIYSFCGTQDADDVTKIVNAFLVKTDNVQTEEDLLDEEITLLTAAFGYLCAKAPAQKQDLGNLGRLLDKFARRARNAGEGTVTQADLLFDELPEEGSYKNAIFNYKIFKRYSEEVQIKTLESCAERLKFLGVRTIISNIKDRNNSDRKWGDVEPWDNWDENDDT